MYIKKKEITVENINNIPQQSMLQFMKSKNRRGRALSISGHQRVYVV